MTQPGFLVAKGLVQNWLSWFQADFRESIVTLLETQFPNFQLPHEIQSVLDHCQEIRDIVESNQLDMVDMVQLFKERLAGSPRNPALLKQIVLRFRRHWAAHTESLRDKTFNLQLIQTLEEEINALDALAQKDWFHQIEPMRIPRAMDFLPVQFIEQAGIRQVELAPRQYDEKFHILQAPSLFLPDLAYLRAKCEMREAPVAIAFMDIDDFKKCNSAHTETKVDRNLLPRFMQAVEGHIYHHGFAYRQGGDEYLILLPSLSRNLAVAFLDELRQKLAELAYPEIPEHATVSIGLCIAERDCPLTDRELKARANDAKNFSKRQGKNRIATYAGPRFVPEELEIVAPSN